MSADLILLDVSENIATITLNAPGQNNSLNVALAGDYAIAAASAKFRSAYTAIGFSGDCGTTYLLPRAIGERRARQLMLTNRALSAQEALDWGLVDAVVADAQLGEESRRLAREFAAGATRALGTVKKLIDQSWRQTFETQLACEGTGMVAMGRSHDAQEAVAAFVEKRAPRFEGR